MPSLKVTKPNTTSANAESDWWKGFANDCIRNRYVLVIGSESVLNKAKNQEAQGDSLRLLFNCTIDYLKNVQGVDLQTPSDFNQLGYVIHHIRTRVLETLERLDFYEQFDDEIDPTLWALLSTRCFRTVLTTCIDPYLEIAMEKVWGKDGFRVLNIYGAESEQDLVLGDLASSNEFNEVPPTLYYLFGKADVDKREQKFVLSENDAMSAIQKWFSGERPKNLLNYIQEDGRKIISVGCKFDDWLFRFFWYLLRGSADNLSSGQVAVEFTPQDAKLMGYLERQHVKIFPDARVFMQSATDKIRETMNMANLLSRKLGGIFISYAYEDKNYALQLFYTLVAKGLNVWIDEEMLKPSAGYDERIEHAINQCEVFMPILSSQVMRDLQGGIGRYYQSEWEKAQLRYAAEKDMVGTQRKMKVLPVVIGQYQERASYHRQRVPDCITKATVYEASTQSLDLLFQMIGELVQ